MKSCELLFSLQILFYDAEGSSPYSTMIVESFAVLRGSISGYMMTSCKTIVCYNVKGFHINTIVQGYLMLISILMDK